MGRWLNPAEHGRRRDVGRTAHNPRPRSKAVVTVGEIKKETAPAKASRRGAVALEQLVELHLPAQAARAANATGA